MCMYDHPKRIKPSTTYYVRYEFHAYVHVGLGLGAGSGSGSGSGPPQEENHPSR